MMSKSLILLNVNIYKFIIFCVCNPLPGYQCCGAATFLVGSGSGGPEPTPAPTKLGRLRLQARVSHFRIYFCFASKRNEAKQKPFRFLFASFCETKTIIFRFVSLPFASIFSLCFASLFQFLL